MPFSIDQLDYLQRTGAYRPRLSAGVALVGTPPPLDRRLWHVKGIGRMDKQGAIYCGGRQ